MAGGLEAGERGQLTTALVNALAPTRLTASFERESCDVAEGNILWTGVGLDVAPTERIDITMKIDGSVPPQVVIRPPKRHSREGGNPLTPENPGLPPSRE